MELKDILDDPPKVHDWGFPTLIHSGLPHEAHARIADKIAAGSLTLETGLGISTAIFALKRANHVCIAPDVAEYERLQKYCQQKGISLDQVRFYLDRSEKVLVNLDSAPLDLVLIDGCHGFPVAFFDFYYLSTMLKVGGCLVIDDIQLWTGRVLTDFLQDEPEWELEVVYDEKTAFFTKRAHYNPGKEWASQPYVVRKSNRPSWFAQLRLGIRYLVRGDVKTLIKKLRKKLRGD